jgi:two-component system, LuxR family, sensor kinase FixL
MASDHNDQTHAQLAAIVQSSDDAIVSKDLSGIVTSWNAAAERLFGYSATEMIGHPITVIFPPDRIGEEAEILRRIADGERVEHFETLRRHKHARDIAVSVTISPIRDAHGAIVGASKIVRDLTERNAREQHIRELQTELAHIQRLTELGQVVSALVHEVNQPLAAIGNYVNACRRLLRSAKTEQTAEGLDKIAGQTERARQIVQSIRDFVRKGEQRLQREHVPQVIDEIVVLTQASVRNPVVRFNTDFHPDALYAEIDKVQVHQVLFNLMRNGIEAMQGPRRELVLATRPADGGMIEVSVADTGSGLSEEVRRNLFRPFVTSKPNGMGVGLSVCRGIIEQHGGRLWAEDNPPGGTIFRFTVRASA